MGPSPFACAEEFRASEGFQSALPTAGTYTETVFGKGLMSNGRYWIRTSDFYRVRIAL